MSLPRVVVNVAAGDGEGWAVEVVLDGSTDPVVAPYVMDSVTLDVDGLPMVVPIPDAGRRPRATAHEALCRGDEAVLRPLLERLGRRAPESNDVALYGAWLLESLLAPAWPALRELPSVRDARGVELALSWAADDVDLHRMVWEAMHDGREFLARHREILVAVTRLVPVDVDPASTITGLPRVLFAVGSPMHDEVVRPGAMFMGLLRVFDAEGRCKSRAVQNVSLDELANECEAFQPDVVHLVAHGSIGEKGRGVLHLRESESGEVDAGKLADVLVQRGRRPLAVVLSACETGAVGGPGSAAPLAAELVERARVPVVCGMVGEISEQACRLYTRQLVKAVYEGQSIIAAAAKGRRAALLASEQPSTELDWALPTLFIARSVSPDFKAIDPERSNWLMGIANGLELHQQPLFIGRTAILDTVNDLFSEDPRRRLGFVAIVREGPLQKLGGTRLLREVGLRLLREGHLPLFLGAYQKEKGPSDLRAVLVALLDRALKVAELLEVTAPPLRTLGVDVGFAEAAQVTPEVFSAVAGDDRIRVALSALFAFSKRDTLLSPKTVGHALARDLQDLARAAVAAGLPFGEHTRVVVLADQLHWWTGATEPLLDMVSASGLGSPEFPVPLIFTASLVEGSGPAIKEFNDNHRLSGYATPELTTLTAEEASLGFLWVLLHQWRKGTNELRPVYTPTRKAPRGSVDNLLSGLLKGLPANVEDDLYNVAHLLHTELELLSVYDDEGAWEAYTSRYEGKP
jgi:CHAT domain